MMMMLLTTIGIYDTTFKKLLYFVLNKIEKCHNSSQLISFVISLDKTQQPVLKITRPILTLGVGYGYARTVK